MNRRDVDEYARTGMPGSSDKSRSDRRSRLRVICDHLNPEQAPSQGVVIPREAIKPPYTATEVQALLRAIQVQPTEEMVRRLCLCVGRGAGAGIDSPDLKLLETTCITDHGADGICVQVSGTHAREVWVLRSYEHLVRRGLQGLHPGQPLVGRVKSRRNVAGAIHAHAVLLGSLPKLEQSRLRTTWLARYALAGRGTGTSTFTGRRSSCRGSRAGRAWAGERGPRVRPRSPAPRGSSGRRLPVRDHARRP
jgi:hypothetical protein